MSDVERQIRQLLSMPISARAFSDALFSPYGLFNKLAPSNEDRKTVAQSPLFQQAQRRLTELERAEAEILLDGIRRMHSAGPMPKASKRKASSKLPAKPFPQPKTNRSNSQRRPRKSG
jgi:hypothetical protein